MNFTRRVVLAKAAGAALLFGMSAGQAAEEFPSRPISMILPGVPAGGASDTLVRMIGAHLTSYWGQPVAVEVKPGGAQGMVGLAAALQAPPDGHTVALLHVNNIAVAPNTMTAPFDPFNDIAYVSMLTIYPSILVVGSQVPANTLEEFIELMKKEPGKYLLGNSGPGGLMDLAGRRLNQLADVEGGSVAYESQTAAINAILSNEIHAVFATPANIIGQVQAGTLKPLAVTTLNRLPQMPDVPAMSEFVPDYSANQWLGLGVSAAVPQPIVDKLAEGIGRALKEPDVKEKLVQFYDSGDTSISTPELFKAFAKSDNEAWAKTVAAAKN
jgi:tripartite-type tricarboxylate transporter receptor subunit TctC